jgi:serine/threonine-protein kinase HipA
MDNRPDLHTALNTAAFYGLTAVQGRHIVDEVMGVLDTWRDVANQVRISRADIELTASAFSAHAAWRKN